MADAEVTVRRGGMVLRGWIQSEVQRSIESLAGTFSVPVPFIPGTVPAVQRGDVVQVAIGDEVVIDGYVLAAEPFYNRTDCGLNVVGRDRAGDLVHSSAIHQGGHWAGVKLDRIAQDICRPFGLDVVVATDIGAPLDDFRLWLGETCLAALARAARLRGVLVMSDAAGRVVLTKAGATRVAGEIRRGRNVIAMQGIGTEEQCHSEYIAYGQQELADDVDFDTARQVKATAKDALVTRYLPLVIPADGAIKPGDLQALVDHTARVRRGHAMGLRYTLEGWTDSGKPWPINALVPVYDDVAGCHGEDWLICAVRNTFDMRDGAVTVLDLRPREAYDTVPLQTARKHRKLQGGRGTDGAVVGR